ncbi:carbohydrate binding family 9 domain-containing protein [bacterium]|jgi:hypothetical protein|nr:carbohydrate binding family 9 domain-containing protein [Verrucomicrobiota bacterium]MDA7632659.1 carbohydrate binding family 9 domain-containing protein [bacterium]
MKLARILTISGARNTASGRFVAFTVCSVLSVLLCKGAPPENDPDEKPSIQAVRAVTPPRIDGVLNEAIWLEAPTAGPLYRYDKNFGQPMSEETRFAILFDDDHLYIGVWASDSSPQEIKARSMERDSTAIFSDDYLYMVLDTFHRQRNGYIFAINPNGTRYDALLTNNIYRNQNWDAAWIARTSTDSEGWTAEIAIPAKSVSFDPEKSVWGFNISRTVARKYEKGRWTGALPHLWTYHVSEAGDIVDLEGLNQGLGLEIAPYVLGRYKHSTGDTDILGEFGTDVRYRVTPNMSATLSYNTDFAETDVDQRQLNFTRFPLFFPERRAFFLEDSGLFEFGGLQTAGRSRVGLSRPLIPFFSRRIGRNLNGEIVPIIAAGKVAGRAGKYQMGLTDVLLDAKDGLGQKNVFAGRIARDVGDQSSVGWITTAGDPNSNDDNLLAGPDFRYRNTEFLGTQTLQANLYGLGSYTDNGSTDSGYSYGGNLTLPNDRYYFHLQYVEIDQAFNPALGFVPRKDIRAYNNLWGFRPRPASISWLRQSHFWYENEHYTDLDNRLETYQHRFTPLSWDLESGDDVSFSYTHNYDAPTSPFDIAGDITIPAGEYSWNHFRFNAELAGRRTISPDLTVQFGDYYDGHRETYIIGGDLRKWKYAALRADYALSQIRLPLQSGETHLGSIRLLLSVTPDLFWTHLVQYDSISESVGYNSRIQWEYRPGAKMFVVLNQNYLANDLSLRVQESVATVKVGGLFRF